MKVGFYLWKKCKEMKGNYVTNKDEYKELLRQAVAVIGTSRLQMAKQLNTVAMSSCWKIGKVLEEKKIVSKHCDSIVKR